jgi:hypothetical protein
MATALSMLDTLRTSGQAARPYATRRDDLITVVLSVWLMIGIFVDGWAHNNLAILETFFTPWHALLYSGFLACAAWIVWLIARQVQQGRTGLAAVPQGYALGLAGVLIFGAGGVGDMVWHTVFGIEQSLDALLSPTHLLLFLGATLVLTSPLRAAWAARDREVAPGWGALLPALLAVALTTSLISFMNMYFWPTVEDFASATAWAGQAARYPSAARRIHNLLMIEGLTGILLANAVLLAPVLLMLRRWRVPFGAVTLIFTLNAVLMGALVEFRNGSWIAAALAAGLAADGLIAALRAGPGRTGALRAVATAVPLVQWALYFVAQQLDGGVAWSIEMWSGVIVMAMLSGLGLSVLMTTEAPARA